MALFEIVDDVKPRHGGMVCQMCGWSNPYCTACYPHESHAKMLVHLIGEHWQDVLEIRAACLAEKEVGQS